MVWNVCRHGCAPCVVPGGFCRRRRAVVAEAYCRSGRDRVHSDDVDAQRVVDGDIIM